MWNVCFNIDNITSRKINIVYGTDPDPCVQTIFLVRWVNFMTSIKMTEQSKKFSNSVLSVAEINVDMQISSKIAHYV